MRTEKQVIDQILSFARGHDMVRAVAMNGSRVNPNTPKDIFCDYDVCYYVTNPRHFLEDQAWIETFGDLIILQQNDDYYHDVEGFIFLMLFSDGVRIDLSFAAMSELAYITEDSLTMVLLDKDQRIAPLPPPSEAGYYIPRPSPKEFAEAVNEIFWCSNNIAKGMFDVVVRDPILKMLAWYAAMQYGWKLNTGKFGRRLKRYLPQEIWESYVKTYAGATYAETWQALFEALRLVRQVGLELAGNLGYDYPLEDDCRTNEYLQRVRALPKDAASFEE
ncbi:MAG: aminoglycoside 6-adenylyltransferase [Anaerolineaceae bacterium]|jgi:aminoglycoside 6-adenylyltransferase